MSLIRPGKKRFLFLIKSRPKISAKNKKDWVGNSWKKCEKKQKKLLEHEKVQFVFMQDAQNRHNKFTKIKSIFSFIIHIFHYVEL